MRHLILAMLVWAGGSARALVVCADDAGKGFVVEPGVRQLFLDDLGLEKTERIQRVLNPPQRHAGNPLITANRPWEQYCAQFGTVLSDDAGKLRMWYLTIPRDRGLKVLEMAGGRIRAPHTTLVGYAESSDGLQWTKPRLGQFAYDGDTNNNLVDLGHDNCEGLGILIDSRDPDPARRFKCLYWDHGAGGFEVRDGRPFSKDGFDDGLCGAVSSDGLHWKSLAENPLLRRYCDTQQNLLHDARLGKYVAFSRFGLGRVLARSESADFIHWSEPEVVLRCDAEDEPGAQIYGAAIEQYEGVYLAMLWIYHEGTDATIDTQLATSRDGKDWTRVGARAVWLPVGDSDSWEGGMVRTAGRVIKRGDELFIYYGGVHGVHNRPGQPPVERKHRGAIGLVTTRRDGFVSLDAGDQMATILTRPFRLPTGELHVNFDGTAGRLQAELCDPDGKALSGLSAGNPITGNHLDATVGWDPKELATQTGQTVRLRITTRGAKLFSYWFVPANATAKLK